jgi:Cu(I)/Ag(I) efflux system membrane fusion protein
MSSATPFTTRVVGVALIALAACRSEKTDHAGHVATPAASVPLTAATMTGHEGHGGDASVPSGYAPVMLEPSQAAAMGLRTVEVAERDFVRKVRTVGVVAVDETRTAHVHAKVRGWIDTISVAFVGQKVAVGQALCSIYSQEVYAAEIEFLSVLDRVHGLPAATGEFAQAEQQAQEQLLAAARRRLSLWDVPKSEIDRLEQTHEAKRTFPLLAPREGIVVSKQALDGMFVDPSVELYTLSDLSRVWVLADVYESDVPFVRVGQKARLDIEGAENGLEAKVAFLAPTVDETTRTLKARFELPNPGGKLRPGAFVTVGMDLGTTHGLAVPESAVIRTGARSIVFVVHGADGARHIEPREIHIGALVSDFYPVEHGLSAGEQVATGAQFLLDSESRLRATSAPGGGHAHH